MRKQRFPSRRLVVAGLLSYGLAVIAAGCGSKGSGGGTAAITPNLSSATPGAQCASGSGGVAYLSTGTTAGATGIEIVPFETTSNQFDGACNASFLTTQGAVSSFSLASGGDGVAIINGGTKIIGLGGIFSGLPPYVTQFSQTPAPSEQPFTSIALLPSGSLALAVNNDPPTVTTAGFIGVNNILGLQPAPSPMPTATAVGATPTPFPSATATAYNPSIVDPSSVSYTAIGVSATASPGTTSSALAVPSTSKLGRPTVALGPDGQTILVRGDQDLTAFAIEQSAAGFFIFYPANTNSPITSIGLGQNTALGYPAGILPGAYAHGLMAFAPNTAAAAIVAGGNGTTAANTVSLLNQIPNNLTVASTLTLQNPAEITSLSVAANGDVAAIGSTNGLTIIKGVAGGTLVEVPQTLASTAYTYTPAAPASGAAVTPQSLAKIVSVGFSADGGYLVVLADNADATASLLVFRVDGNGILSSPTGAATLAPTTVGPRVVLPAGDTMVVR